MSASKKKRKLNSNVIILFLVLVIIIITFFSIRQTEEKVEVIEESEGSGLLEIESFPDDADIFMDDVYSGKSPITLYDIPVGSHNIIIKKDGYEDFTTKVDIEAGRKAFLEADLVLIPVIKEKEEIVEEVTEETEEKVETEIESNIINLGENVLLYYDFSEEKFTSNKQVDSDIFSRKLGSYIIFTRYHPVKIKTIGKSVDKVEKQDCIDVKGQFEYLYSGETLCVITKENEIIAIGGNWQDLENVELKWKLFS